MTISESWTDEIIKEYGSLEGYMEYMYRNGAEPLLYGYTPFRYFLIKDY